MEILLFAGQSRVYAALHSFIDALSSAFLIVAVDFSRISALNRILLATNMSSLEDIG
jgi:hypothetical protein